MKFSLLPVLLLVPCITLFGCSEWFTGDDDDTNCYYDDDGVRVCATRVDGGGLSAAPNIYLYPETAGNISVKLTFADEAGVFTQTDPEHGDEGWTVWVEPGGLIDGTYDYLYYAGELRSEFQLAEGWAVEGENIFQWFEDIMLQMGLKSTLQQAAENLPVRILAI